MTPAARWADYVAAFHAERPGITEAVLTRCAGDPYGWLAESIPNGAVRVLDLACGSGPLFGRLSDRGYLGVDLSGEELSAAARGGARPLVRADAARLPLGDGSVDAVVCCMALQVLSPLAGVLDELARVVPRADALVALLPASGPLRAGDWVRYIRLLGRLRRPRLDYPNVIATSMLAAHGWRVVSDATRRFGYRIERPEDGRRLVDSLYLPGTDEAARQRGRELAAGWLGVELGVPLRRIVAVRV